MPILMDDLKTLAMIGSLRTAAVYVALIILMGIVLTYRVIVQRRTKLIGIGDGGDKVVARRVRIHGNFCENAPFALALLVLLPLLGTASLWIHIVGGLFLAGRVAHAYGFSQSAGSSVGRVGGMIMTHFSLFTGVGLLLFAAFGR
ncbi:MAG: MAPEG family protein [Beijerinckiaceae bacterium]